MLNCASKNLIIYSLSGGRLIWLMSYNSNYHSFISVINLYVVFALRTHKLTTSCCCSNYDVIFFICYLLYYWSIKSLEESVIIQTNLMITIIRINLYIITRYFNFLAQSLDTFKTVLSLFLCNLTDSSTKPNFTYLSKLRDKLNSAIYNLQTRCHLVMIMKN